MRKVYVVIIVIVVAGLAVFYWSSQRSDGPAKSLLTHQSKQPTSSNESKKPAQPNFNKTKYSISQADSLWVVVNKQRPLSPLDYAPANLVVPNIPLRSNITKDEEHVSVAMAPALEKMVDAAKQQGISLNLQSGYRSYNFQVNLYNHYVATQGKAIADSQSARPGHSEHQTGLAADLGGASNPACNVEQCFAGTTEGKWLAANSYKYGFIIRYPKGDQAVSGYIYEPWHVRYVGTGLSNQMHREKASTLEQFFSLPAAPDYD